MTIIDDTDKYIKRALQLVNNTNESVFLTGKAGTGKSTLLKHISETTQKKHIVLAPTGIAAINAGGQTIHSFFKAPFRPVLIDDADLSLKNGRIFEFLKYTKTHRKLIESIELIIIDEISMVRADLIDFIDRVLRVFTGNLRLPFGGKQMLLVGDIFQLEPVVKRDEWTILSQFYKSPYFFSAKVFSELNLVCIELSKVYRQNDAGFVALLDRIRVNKVLSADLDQLNKRVVPDFEATLDKAYITLASRKDTVDYINARALEQLPVPSKIFNGELRGDFPKSSLPVPLELELKPGAQVMFVKNDLERRYVNGTIAKILSIDDNEICVELQDETTVELSREIWHNIRYTYDEKDKRIIEEELGHYVQFPLKLAWAVTIHKSQGLTFDNVIVDLGNGAFAGGQTYVALSRCRSLEGMILKNKVKASDIFVRSEVQSFASTFNSEQIYQKTIETCDADRLYNEAYQFYKNGNADGLVNAFALATAKNNRLSNPLVKRFVRLLLSKLFRLKVQITAEQSKYLQYVESLKPLAKEFYEMGNECVIRINDHNAAVGNYGKAIQLNPFYYDAYIRRGIAYCALENYLNAETDFSKAIEINNRLFKGYYQRGKLYLHMNNFDAAIDDFNKALEINPKYKKVYTYLGNAYSKIGDVVKATECWSISSEK